LVYFGKLFESTITSFQDKMTKNNLIYRSILGDLDTFKIRYKEELTGDKISRMEFVDYLLKIEGKGMRPTILFLSAHLHGVVNEKSIYSAVILELTHMASLVHDDIVDEAFQRRGRYSINALWRSKKAVLIGDYIFARAILTASNNELYSALGDVASVLEDMSLGELEQSDASIRLDVDESKYFEVIRSKTGSLMSCSARLGAKSVNASDADVAKMSKLGELIGLVFQIKDDILDFTGDESGKMKGNDLKEHKITLPLIYALKRSDKSEANTILKLLRERSDKSGYISKITQFVVGKGGIDAAYKKMDQIKEDAKNILLSYDDSEYRQSYFALLDYICDRKK